MHYGKRLNYLMIVISTSLMNRVLTISAIAMFAVVLGLSSVAPAIADKPEKVMVCHNEADAVDPDTLEPIPPFWTILEVSEKSLKNGHDGKHGDGITDEFQILSPEDEATCRGLPNFVETVDEDLG